MKNLSDVNNKQDRTKALALWSYTYCIKIFSKVGFYLNNLLPAFREIITPANMLPGIQRFKMSLIFMGNCFDFFVCLKALVLYYIGKSTSIWHKSDLVRWYYEFIWAISLFIEKFMYGGLILHRSAITNITFVNLFENLINITRWYVGNTL